MNGITSPFHPVFMASTGHLRLYSHNVAAVVRGRGGQGQGEGEAQTPNFFAVYDIIMVHPTVVGRVA